LIKDEQCAVELGAVSRKDLSMEWDQIENKWAAMTHRIRTDWRAAPQTPGASADMRVTFGTSDAAPTPKMPGATQGRDGIALTTR